MPICFHTPSEIDQHIQRLGWDTERGQRYLIETYGVRSRIKLSDRQLLEFLGYLKSLPTFTVGQTFENPKEKAVEVAVVHLSPVLG